MTDIEKNYQKQLVNSCLKGDRYKFKLLIEPFKNSLLNYLFKFTGNKSTAEDLFQETLIKVWQGLRNYKDTQKFSSWLFTIAHNIAIDEVRKRKRHLTIVELNTELKDSNQTPVNKLINNEVGEKIDIAISGLSEKQKTVFLLRTHSGMKFREISEVLKMPINSVLSNMNYAVKKLRSLLKEEDAA